MFGLASKHREELQKHNVGMATKLASIPPIVKDGVIVDWSAANSKEREDHFKNVDEQFEETFGEHA